MRRCLLILCLTLALPAIGLAQPSGSAPGPAAASQGARPAPPPELAAADDAFQREDWQAAADNYFAANAKGVESPLLHFRLGFALHMLKRYEEALEHHLLATRIGNPALRIDAIYNVACANALLGNKEEAIRYFALAVDAGFADGKQVEIDTDLDSLRGDPRFVALVEGMGKVPRLHQQLDPLLGVWVATNDQGQETEHLVLSRPLANSHAILTTSTTRAGGVWTGLLIPNHAERTWTWVQADSIGTTSELTGPALDTGGVRLVGRLLFASGPGPLVAVTLAPGPNGTMIETEEASDDGVTWRVRHTETFGRVEETKLDAGS